MAEVGGSNPTRAYHFHSHFSSSISTSTLYRQCFWLCDDLGIGQRFDIASECDLRHVCFRAMVGGKILANWLGWQG